MIDDGEGDRSHNFTPNAHNENRIFNTFLGAFFGLLHVLYTH